MACFTLREDTVRIYPCTTSRLYQLEMQRCWLLSWRQPIVNHDSPFLVHTNGFVERCEVEWDTDVAYMTSLKSSLAHCKFICTFGLRELSCIVFEMYTFIQSTY